MPNRDVTWSGKTLLGDITVHGGVNEGHMPWVTATIPTNVGSISLELGPGAAKELAEQLRGAAESAQRKIEINRHKRGAA